MKSPSRLGGLMVTVAQLLWCGCGAPEGPVSLSEEEQPTRTAASSAAALDARDLVSEEAAAESSASFELLHCRPPLYLCTRCDRYGGCHLGCCPVLPVPWIPPR